MRPLQSFWQDIRMAFRVLKKSPGATGLSVLSIALGIGLTTGVFSVGDAMLLRPFPFERPGEVFQVYAMGDDGKPLFPGWDDYRDMARAGAGLLDMAAYQGRGVMLARGEDTEAILANPVTPNFFSFLGVRAALGRATVDSVAGRPGVVLGHRLWQRRFGSDPQVVGKTVLLNGQALVVNAVMPAQFTGLQRGVAIDVFVSMDTWFDVLGHTEEKRGRNGQFEFVARLKPGVTAGTRGGAVGCRDSRAGQAQARAGRQCGDVAGGKIRTGLEGQLALWRRIGPGPGPGFVRGLCERDAIAAGASGNAQEGTGRPHGAGRRARDAWRGNC